MSLVPACRLDDHQRQEVLQLAAQALLAALDGGPLPRVEKPWGQQPVWGAFVTLKRAGHLRACCGVLGRSFPLAEAVVQAAWRTAREDHRFPALRRSELPYQTVEVSLLHGQEVLPQTAEGRLRAIEIGRDGLVIRHAGRSGLLLPQVAEEQGWDAETFLRQVCVKAGLPTTAWEDPRAHLERFEALRCQEEWAALVEGEVPTEPAIVSPQSLDALERAVAANVAALREGQTPSYVLPGLPDGEVDGLALWLGDSQSPEAAWIRYVLRGGVPLQATLYQLAEAAARSHVQGAPHLAVFHQTHYLGFGPGFDRRGFDPTRRALAVIEQGHMSVVFDRELNVDALWQRIESDGGVAARTMARVVSVVAESACDRFFVTTRPRPKRNGMVRPPAVAGQFYPGSARGLEHLLDELWPAGEVRRRAAPAVMVPHAGLIYSGHIAADVLRRVEIPQDVIIVCPKHTPHGVPWAVAPVATWQLPGEPVAGNLALAERLADQIDGLELDEAAHRREHAIEVELPILRRLRPDVRVVGVAIGGGTLEEVRALGDQLAAVVEASSPRPLLVISSDMNHYLDDATTRKLDRMALDAMATGDPAELYRTVRTHNITMCGVLPAVAVMESVRAVAGAVRYDEVAYDTSARVSGDDQRVVGYAGVILDAPPA